MRFLMAQCFLFASLFSMAQYENSADNWDLLSKIEYEISTDEYGEIYLPKFDDLVKEMEGKQVSLQGFIIPFEGMFEPKHIIISSLPIAACFFCGGSGPETVAEAYLSEEIQYTSKPVTVTGVMKLNNTDYEKLMYILEDAKVSVE